MFFFTKNLLTDLTDLTNLTDLDLTDQTDLTDLELELTDQVLADLTDLDLEVGQVGRSVSRSH